MQSLTDSVFCMDNATDLALISNGFTGEQARPFWMVYNYVAVSWYEEEHGTNNPREYRSAMIFLECIAAGWTPQRALDYIAPWGYNAR